MGMQPLEFRAMKKLNAEAVARKREHMLSTNVAQNSS